MSEIRIPADNWSMGCCAMTHQSRPNSRGEIVLLTRNHGADVTRVEIYGSDNAPLGPLREIPNDGAEAEAIQVASA